MLLRGFDLFENAVIVFCFMLSARYFVSNQQMALEDRTLVFDFGTYNGDVSVESGKRHGFGILSYNNGNSYEGMWADGAAHGVGTKRYRNGDLYHGEWQNGKRDGKGEYHFVQGDLYTGGYRDDVCDGRGKLVTRDGDCYEGEWEGGKKHGEGVETLAVGNTFRGTWKRGKKNGVGSLTTPTERIVGIWEADRCVEVTSRQEMEYQPQVRPYVSSSMSHVSSSSDDAIALQPHMLDEMRRAGADETLVRAMADFSNQMSGRMTHLMGGINSMETQLSALADSLEALAGLNDLDVADGDEGAAVGDDDDEEDSEGGRRAHLD